MTKKLLLINFLIFGILLNNAYSENNLVVSEKDRKIFYIDGQFDSNAADRAKKYCKSYNLNTYFFRSKDKETFDVQVKRRLLKKDKLLWRFFCSLDFDEAESKFNSVLNDKNFNSKLKKISNSQIEVRVWDTRVKPKVNSKTKNNTDDNNGDFPLFAVLFIGVIIWIILRPKKNKIIKKNEISNNLSKKSKLDLIEEWKNNRK